MLAYTPPLSDTAVATICRFMAESAHGLSNMVMDLDFARLMGEETDMADASRLLSSYTLTFSDLPLLVAGTAQIPMQRLDLAQVLAEVERIVRVRFERVPCTLRVEAEAGLIQGNAERLFRVLYILLDNANVYTTLARDTEGVVEVVLRHGDDNTVIVEVMDNGTGVPLPLRSLLGQPGVRGTNAVPGAGWSLFYVCEVMKLHGGSAVFADAPLGGLLVRLTFPEIV